ncbi:MAG: 50S ribosomal protein L32 [Patescibacteria group bacterium]
MSVQPKRRTSSQKKRRASHFALTKANLTQCLDCGTKVLPHRLCPKCGSYTKGKK